MSTPDYTGQTPNKKTRGEILKAPSAMRFQGGFGPPLEGFTTLEKIWFCRGWDWWD